MRRVRFLEFPTSKPPNQKFYGFMSTQDAGQDKNEINSHWLLKVSSRQVSASCWEPPGDPNQSEQAQSEPQPTTSELDRRPRQRKISTTSAMKK